MSVVAPASSVFTFVNSAGVPLANGTLDARVIALEDENASLRERMQAVEGRLEAAGL